MSVGHASADFFALLGATFTTGIGFRVAFDEPPRITQNHSGADQLSREHVSGVARRRGRR